MKTVTVIMNEKELRKFESFKEAENIVRGIKRGLKEVKQSKDGKIQLKSARQLADEIWSYYRIWEVIKKVIKEI